MPNAQITVYLTDEEYIKYIKVKEKVFQECKDIIKKEIKR